MARKNPSITCRQIQQNLNLNIFEKTIRRCLNENKHKAFAPRKKLLPVKLIKEKYFNLQKICKYKYAPTTLENKKKGMEKVI